MTWQRRVEIGRGVMNRLGPSGTRVLFAVIALHTERRRPTVRTVAALVGMTSSPTYYHLRRLRELGLVDWTEGRSGTLVPLVAAVPFGESRDWLYHHRSRHGGKG